MEKAMINGIELAYETKGSGEPVLFIGTGPIANSFLPLASEKGLSDRYHLILYHQRGQVGSARTRSPVNYVQHAADAAALLRHLGIERAHVAGHSTGGAIALQLAIDFPEVVHSLALLEPLLMDVPSAGAFLEKAGPALVAYGSGDHEGAMSGFLSAVSGLDWNTCRAVIDGHVPGGVAQAVKDADTVFAGYLPALQAWQFGSEHARSITRPVLSVLGTKSEPLFREGRELLHSWLPQVEDCTIEGLGHLLHMQRPDPVAQAVGSFFGRHAFSES